MSELSRAAHQSDSGPSKAPPSPLAKSKDVDALLSENKGMKRVLSKVTLERFKAGQDIGKAPLLRPVTHRLAWSCG